MRTCATWGVTSTPMELASFEGVPEGPILASRRSLGPRGRPRGPARPRSGLGAACVLRANRLSTSAASPGYYAVFLADPDGVKLE